MAVSYVEIIGINHSGTHEVHCIGSPFIYANIQWIVGTPIAQATLDNEIAAYDPITVTNIGDGLLYVSGFNNEGGTRTLVAPAAGITISNADGVAGNPTFALANDLGALEGLGSTGFAVRTAADTWTQRTIVAGAGLSIINGDGVAGNPTLSVDVGSAATAPLIFDDFTFLSITGNVLTTTTLSWSRAFNGTGATILASTTDVNSTQQALGQISLETGTNAAGRAGFASDETFLFGWAEFALEWFGRVVTLATVAQNYNCYLGFSDGFLVAGEPTDGAYFEYDFDVSPNWRIVTANNGTRTKVTTSVVVSAVDLQKLKVVVNNTGTSAEYFIDDVSAGTITTDIPTGAGRFFSMGTKIEKTAGSTNRQLLLDYVSIQYTYATPR